MGLGCNAVGVTGCRIIDSQRERLVAILTNSFMPCNGRFPTLISIFTLFFMGGTASGLGTAALMAVLLTVVILVGALMTFLTSRLLSDTVLKGKASSFALELPPYRVPQFGKVLLRSLLDRTLFVLGRAAAVAAPAGLLLWVLANVRLDGGSLLSHCAGFLDPTARFFGLDGVILLAFILGFPANEIVMPIILMAYMSEGALPDTGGLDMLRSLLTDHGWTWVTAICVMIFCLMHWPCSTTCWTIRKETGSWRYTLLAMLLPTAAGLLLCAVVSHVCRFFV